MYQHKGWHFPNLDNHFGGYVGEWPENSYQQQAFDTALNYVKNFELAIDVGANIGLHTVRMSKKFKKVYAFEPTTLNFECLDLNTKNLLNVNLIKSGLGEKNCTEKISIPENSNNCGVFSIVDFINSDQTLISETIQIDTLDKFNLTPNLIKIDTQGFELSVLRGSITTLKSKPVLIIECERKSDRRLIADFLKDFNYTMKESVRKDTIWTSD